MGQLIKNFKLASGLRNGTVSARVISVNLKPVFRCIRALLLFTAISLPVFGQTYYVRAGATGGQNGTDWNNAYSSLPPSFVRGATYYVASGNYPGRRSLNLPTGTALITIKKAIESDHGTSTGWQSAYGTGQSVFGGIDISGGGYLLFDGQTGGGPGSWTSGYGFKVVATSNNGFGINSGNNVTIKHVEVQGDGGDGDGNGVPNDLVWVGPCANITVSYCYLYDAGRCLMFCNHASSNVLFDYIYCGKFESTPNEHSEAASIWGGAAHWTFSNSVFTHTEGTGGLILEGDDFKVYNCVFVALPGGSFSGGNGAVGTWTASKLTNFKVYNNSFINIDGLAIGLLNADDTGEFKNNIFYNCSVGQIGPLAHSYNLYVNVPDMPSESTRTTGTSDPFVNFAALNFSLKSASPGSVLAAPFDIDLLGNVRGADGAWDKGAVEFGGVTDTTPPVISNVGISSVASKSARISWTTDKISTSAVDYGTSTSYGATINDAQYVTSHQVTLSNLVAGTTYHLRVRSLSTAGSAASSGDLSFTTASADTTPPSVALTSPTPNATASGTLTLAANATDNTGGVGVSTVTFLIDGVAVGSDSTSPYSLQWNSWTVANGAHSVQAKAQDFESNQSVSSLVNVNVQNTTPSTLSENLVAYWGFDDPVTSTVSDSTQFQNNGALSGGVVQVTGGKLHEGLSFDGVNGSVSVANSPSLEITGPISLAAWVKPTAAGGWQSVLRKIVQEGSHAFPFTAYDLLLVDNGGTSFEAKISLSGTDGSRTSASSSLALPYGSWYHIVGTYDGSTARIYVNGTEAGNAPFTGPIIQTGQPLLLGRNGAGTDLFRGILDDVRVYSRPLSPTEVQALFNIKPPSSPVGLVLVPQ